MAVRRKSFTTKKVGSDDVIFLDVDDKSFQCVSRIPGMALIDFLTGMDEDDPRSMGIGIFKFFKSALGKSYDDFEAYANDPEHPLELEQLAEMAGWLAEQYSGGNPTVLSQLSSAGSPSSGQSSEAALSAAAAI